MGTARYVRAYELTHHHHKVDQARVRYTCPSSVTLWTHKGQWCYVPHLLCPVMHHLQAEQAPSLHPITGKRINNGQS